MNKLLFVLMVGLLIACAGCSDQQLQKTEDGAAIVGKGAKTAAPYLPPPFNYIAQAIAGIAAITGGIVSYKQSKRAKTAEVRANEEAEAKRFATDAVNSMSNVIDTMLTSGDPDVVRDTEKWLKRLGEFKKKVGHVERAGMVIFDAIRKAPDYIPRRLL